MKLDIIFLQEVENEKFELPGYNVVCNVDYARRGTAIALKEHIQFSQVEKSLDGRLIKLKVQNTTLCNVYAPSGSALRAERERFFNGTISYYLRHNSEHVVLAGDANCVLRPDDATHYNNSPALKATVQQLSLHDVWVKLYPSISAPTYITHNSTSRLDRIYVSNGLCEQLISAATHVCSFTDYKGSDGSSGLGREEISQVGLHGGCHVQSQTSKRFSVVSREKRTTNIRHTTNVSKHNYDRRTMNIFEILPCSRP